MSELVIPVSLQTKIGDDTDKIARIFREIGEGSEEARKELLKLTGEDYKVSLVTQFNNKGEVKTELKKQNDLIDNIKKAYDKANRVAAGSLTSLRQQVNTLKQSRDAVVKYDAKTGELRDEWVKIDQEIESIQRRLKKLDSPMFDKIKKMGGNNAMASLAVGFSKAVPLIGQATMAMQSLEPVMQAVNGAVNTLVSRQKQIEGLTMALKGFGVSGEDINTVFSTATGIALGYGVSLSSVEKGYKRMTPTILAAGGSIDDVGTIMASMAARTATLGLNAEQSQRYMEAFAQVMGKGKLQGEELNQQFAELDGSMKPMIAEFIKAKYGIEDMEGAMQRGEISSGMFAEAVVHGSKEMRDNMKKAFDDIQGSIDSMNIAQVQSIISTLNTISLEGLGKLFGSLGRDLLELQATFSQFFASLVTNADGLGQVFSMQFGVVVKALTLSTEAVLVIIGSINNLLSWVSKAGEAFENWAMKFEVVQKVADTLKNALSGMGNAWNAVKNWAMGVNKETAEAKDTMDLTHKATQEFTISLDDAASTGGSLVGVSTDLATEMLAMADEVINAKSATFELTEAEKELLDTTIKLIQQQTQLVQTSSNLADGLGDQVAEITASAGSFDEAGMSADEYNAKLMLVGNSVNSQISSLSKLLGELSLQEAATGSLSTEQEKAKSKAEDLLKTYLGYSASVKDAKAESQALANEIANSSVHFKNYLEMVEAVTGALQISQGVSKGELALSQELGNAYMSNARALQDKKEELDDLIGTYSLNEQAMASMSAAEANEFSKLVKTSQQYDEKIKKLEALAAQSVGVVKSNGQLTESMKAQIERLRQSSEATGLNAEQTENLNQKREATAALINGALSAAEKEYQGLMTLQISGARALTVEEQNRAASLLKTINSTKEASEALDKMAESTAKVASAPEPPLTPWQEYTKSIRDAADSMEFAIEKGANLSNSLDAVSGAMAQSDVSAYSTRLDGVSVSVDAVTKAVSDQISELERHSQALEIAAASGIALTEAERERLAVMRKMIAALKEQNAEMDQQNKTLKNLQPTAAQQVMMANELKSSYNDLRGEMSAAKKEMDALAAANKQGTREFAAAKVAYDDAAEKMSKLEDRTKSLRSQFEEYDRQWGKTSGNFVRGVNNANVSSDAALNTVKRLWVEMNTLDTSLEKATDSTDDFTSATKEEASAVRDSTNAVKAKEQALAKVADAQKEANKASQEEVKPKENTKTTYTIYPNRMGWDEIVSFFSQFSNAEEAIAQEHERRMKRIAEAQKQLSEKKVEYRKKELAEMQSLHDKDMAMMSTATGYRASQLEKYKADTAAILEGLPEGFTDALNKQTQDFDRFVSDHRDGLAALRDQAANAGNAMAAMKYDLELQKLEDANLKYQERVELIKRAAALQMQSAQADRDAKLRQIELEREQFEVIKTASDERLRMIDKEMEAMLAASNLKIKGLQEQTPAERKLAELRKEELEAKAKNTELSERERLEAQAALERMEQQLLIEKERARQEKERAKLEKKRAEEQAKYEEDLQKDKEANEAAQLAFEDRINKVKQEYALKEAAIKRQFIAKEEAERLASIDTVNSRMSHGIDEYERKMRQAHTSLDDYQDLLHERELKRIKEREKAYKKMIDSLPNLNLELPSNRASGGPVSGGTKYTVNELGKEGFMDRMGNIKQINAPAWGSWRAPSSGTVIPAHIWSELKASQSTSVAPGMASSAAAGRTGNAALIRALAGLTGGNQDRITNNVTIQSDSPVQAASDMMVQMTRLKRRRR